jgi:hypothetical protein
LKEGVRERQSQVSHTYLKITICFFCDVLFSGEFTFRKMYVNENMISTETIPGMEGERMKEIGGGGKFKYDIFNIL